MIRGDNFMIYNNSKDKEVDEALTKGIAKLAKITPMGQEDPLPLSYPERDIIDTLPPKGLDLIPKICHLKPNKKNT